MPKQKLEKAKNIFEKKSQKNTRSKLSNNNLVDKNEKSLFRDSDAQREPERSLRNKKRERDSKEAGNRHSLYDSQKNTESKPSNNNRVDKRNKSLFKDSDAPMEPETRLKNKKTRVIDSGVAGKAHSLHDSRKNAESKPSNNNRVDERKKSLFKDSDAPMEPETRSNNKKTGARNSGEDGDAHSLPDSQKNTEPKPSNNNQVDKNNKGLSKDSYAPREPEISLTGARDSGEAGNVHSVSVNIIANAHDSFIGSFTSNGTFSFYYHSCM